MDTITTAAKNNPIYTAAAADNRCRYFYEYIIQTNIEY